MEPTVWKPFFILLAFFIFQEGSGIYVILFYAVDFFREVGTSVDEFMASISVGVARLVMSIVGAALLGRFDRRTLAMTSAIGMTLAMSVTSSYEFIFAGVPTHIRPFAWLPAICILIHVCVSMIGMLQLPWIMTSELFPLKVRSFACGLVTAAAHLFIFASVKTYPALSGVLGMSGTLVFFASASFCGAIFVYALLPETKGKTLMEIECEFRNKNRKRKIVSEINVYTVEENSEKLGNKINFNNLV
jgi:facilitated trehalose transporter